MRFCDQRKKNLQDFKNNLLPLFFPDVLNKIAKYKKDEKEKIISKKQFLQQQVQVKFLSSMSLQHMCMILEKSLFGKF